MAKKYTLQEARQLKGPPRTRTSGAIRKNNFWEDLDDIELAILKFADVMRDKMFDKAAEEYFGWDDKSYTKEIEQKLLEQVEKGNYVNVANFAMMLHFLKTKTEDTA